jgi:hypothetical protein
MPVARVALVLVVAASALLGAATPTNASSGGIKVMVTGNCVAYPAPLATMIAGKTGVASATAFDTSASIPTAAQLAAVNVVVSLGDGCGRYFNARIWGDRLANYVDQGGVVIQAAYDNWDSSGTHPLGRFASAGYPPLTLGPAANESTELGTVLQPKSPIVQGLDTFVNGLNTTTGLAPGATLLAKWADGRDAIAVKGRVVATSASGDEPTAMVDIAQIVVNSAKFFDVAPNTKITKVSVNSGKHLASIRFSAVGYASGFKCALFPPKGGVVAYKSCTSPKKYTRLAPGKYTFKVMAVSPYGKDSTPASKRFVISG